MTLIIDQSKENLCEIEVLVQRGSPILFLFLSNGRTYGLSLGWGGDIVCRLGRR